MLMSCLIYHYLVKLKKDERFTFDQNGRKLNGTAEILEGYRTDMVKIADVSVIKKSGLQHHPVISHTGNRKDIVSGTAFALSHQELLAADAYQVDDSILV